MSSQTNIEPGSAVRPTEVSALSYRRIVVKAGTSLLTSGADRLNHDVMAALVKQIATLRQRGSEIMLVSSGAVAAGRHVLNAAREDKNVLLRQALAAVGQGHLMHIYEQLFREHDVTVAQALLSRRDLSDRLGYLNVRNTLLALLERSVVPVINENDVVAVEELTGGERITPVMVTGDVVEVGFHGVG